MARKNSRSDETRPEVSRRKFLAGAAVTGAAVTAATTGASAAAPPAGAAKIPSVVRPTAHQVALEANVTTEVKPMAGRAGSDFMVDVIKSLDIDYCYSNPASSFRGLHESLINYGKNTKPEFITCMHEESSVAMAHGYFKVTGKPQMMLCHGTVGLMHATMAIYNAWADRVPVILVGGNDLDAAKRPPGVPTYHSGQDINALVRDITKWDDNPVSLQHFAQSFVRAYKMSMTPPYEPVMIALDGGLQEEPMNEHGGSLYIPKYVKTAPPHADLNALRETAKLLVNAENPVIVVDRMARSQDGIKFLVQLAELVQAPVVDQSNRMNFPNTHHLCQSPQAQPLIRNADVVIGLEVADFWNTVNLFIDNGLENGLGTRQARVKPGTKLITISSAELNQKSNYQDFQRFQSVDISMVGDAEASLPFLIEAVKSAISNDRKAAYEKRGEAMKKAWQQSNERVRQAAAVGWDANPISVPRLCAEVWAQIKDLDYSFVASRSGIGSWPNRLWKMDKHYHWLGGSGGGGVGYGLPASVGAAHANKPLGRFSVSMQGDGDLMFAPGAMWTAARHKIPSLSVLQNNKGYHQEVMHVQRMSNRRNRVANLGTSIKDLGPVGTRIENPDMNYQKLAESMGWYATPPISDPAALGPALKRAIEVVKSGQPAMVDVVSQAR
jgi:thiamine pyrophosphate-dependent acetolactate synthase large subunit-like protein